MGIRDDAEDLGVPSGLPSSPSEEVVVPDPSQMIEVRTQKWRSLDGFWIQDGFDISSRPRLEEDADATYVIVKTRPPATPAPEKADWPKWGESGRVDPRLAKYDRPQRGWNHWSLGRNSGVLRADGSVEP